MELILRLIFRPIGLMLVGIAATVLGFNMAFGDPSPIPDRAGLKDVSGVLDAATKITKKRRIGKAVVYELEIKDASGAVTKLTLPEGEIAEQQVKDLFGVPVRVLYAGDKDVWELSAGDRRVIDYEDTKTKRQKSQVDAVSNGPYVAGGGLLTFLVGMLWKLWRRRPKLG